jgi:hypothetical protein
MQHRDMRSGALTCVYCGVRPSATVDHMPPLVVFDGRRRPAELEFPACEECNRATSAVDTIIGWLSRIYPDAQTAEARADMKKVTHAVITNYPEVASGIQRIAAPPYVRLPSGFLVKEDRVHLRMDEYIATALEQFGIKFGLAMHWLETRQIASKNARISVMAFSNYQDSVGEIPNAVFRIFPRLEMLRQGAFTSENTFRYGSRVESDQRFSAHMCTMRYSFMVLAMVDENHDVATDEFKSFSRSDLHRPYPYGLPKLPPEEIEKRFASVHGPHNP